MSTCPKCGAAVKSAGAGQGMCPRCLLGRAIGDDAAAMRLPGVDASDDETATSHDAPRVRPASGSAVRGETIGPYRLVRRVGVGGMGEVWLAEQKQPVRRRVAFKVIKRGMDTSEVVARFEAERQALALMDHPNGRQGARRRCDDAAGTAVLRHGTTCADCSGHGVLRSRTNLDTQRSGSNCFQRRSAPAVQHAHQKAHHSPRSQTVEHPRHPARRGSPVPKVIDFGVAKATEPTN